MPRRLRLESESGVYHVINRGNYRANIFRSDKAKAAFLNCVAEACERTGWRVHAWAILSNHYHLAIFTPQANLVDGMCWLQGTFASRFNRFRSEHGHLFQGRYKSLVVDPEDGLGALCHYIHLNPVRAGLCPQAALKRYRWSSVAWLAQRALRPTWYDPAPALRQAGGLPDNAAGVSRYLQYLAWLAEDEPEQKRQRFEQMSRGWIVGGEAFTRALVEEHGGLRGQGPRLARELQAAREAQWQEVLDWGLRKLGRQRRQIQVSGKFVPWKVALAAALKARTTVTNRWLSRHLAMGSLHEVSRQVAAWTRQPEPSLQRKLDGNHKLQTTAP